MRVLHLTGSAVSAFMAELSRLYARDCLEATHDPGDEVHLAAVAPDGSWRFPASLDDDALAAAPPLPLADALRHITGLGVELVLPQMFCLPGMTHYRALFDVLGIPYVGNTPAAMALTADKARAKAVVAAAGVRVPAGELVRAGEAPTLPPPVVVKPNDADNSLGVTLVRTREAYAAALAGALEHADAALVEAYVPLGREVRCGVLELNGELVCLPLEEYAVGDVRGPGDKLARDAGGALGLVAKETTKAWILEPSDPVTEAVWAAARRCHVALGCRHYSLFDFRIDADGEPWFLEAGLYCSFARKSVVAVMAAATGIDARQLLERVAAEAFAGAAVRRG